MDESKLDVVMAGHICLDLTPQFLNPPGMKISQILRPGTLVNMTGMTIGTGGAVSNSGFAFRIFGCDVAYIAKIGKDDIGEMTLNILKKYGSADGVKVAEDVASSYTVAIAPVGIDRIFLHCPGANDEFTHVDIDFELVTTAKLFHFGYPTLMKKMLQNQGKETALIFEKAKQTGVTTALDITLPDPNSDSGKADWNAIYQKTLPNVDIFMPSIEEALFTLNPNDYLQRKETLGGEELIDHISPNEFSQVADRLIAMGCAMTGLKAGHNGWYFKTASADRLAAMGKLAPKEIEQWADTEKWCPAFQVESIASAAGAGDNSIAAFLTALLKEYPLRQCLKIANCAGYLNLKSIDTLGGLVSWNEMLAIMKDLKVRDIPALKDTDWRWNDEWEIWQK